MLLKERNYSALVDRVLEYKNTDFKYRNTLAFNMVSRVDTILEKYAWLNKDFLNMLELYLEGKPLHKLNKLDDGLLFEINLRDFLCNKSVFSGLLSIGAISEDTRSLEEMLSDGCPIGEIPIGKLNLNPRLHRSLRRENVDTLEKLFNADIDMLKRRYAGVGVKSVNDLNTLRVQILGEPYPGIDLVSGISFYNGVKVSEAVSQFNKEICSLYSDSLPKLFYDEQKNSVYIKKGKKKEVLCENGKDAIKFIEKLSKYLK